MPRRFLFFTFLYFVFFAPVLKAKTYDVPLGVEWIRQLKSLVPGQVVITYNTMQVNLRGGDSLLLIGGTRMPLRIDDLYGDSLKPIVVANKNSRVVITKPIGGYFGISFTACRYIKVTGKNNPSLAYGILITDLPSGSALSVNNYSSNFEIEGIEISKIYSSGIVAKTDVSCTNYSTYGNFVMYDLKFHNNYIHHTGNEGFYIGNTSYAEGTGGKLVCSNPSYAANVLPHKIIGVKVYENIMDSNGWDAIQVSAAEKVEIYDNFIRNDSYADVMNQQSGIMIGQPTQAKVYRNIIMDGKGQGIQCFGIGTSIFNNLIINPGISAMAKGTYSSSGKLENSVFTYGIYINDKVCKDITLPRLPYTVAHNTIIIPKIFQVGAPYNSWAPQGINANSLAYITSSYFVNNLLVIDSNTSSLISNPINGVYASNSVPNYSTTNSPAFISTNSKSNLGNNYYSNEIQAVTFTNWLNGNYTLQSSSTAIDGGVSSAVFGNKDLGKDLLLVARPQGSSPDFGCYEMQATKTSSAMPGMYIVPNPISINALAQGTFTAIINNEIPITNMEVKLVGTYKQYNLTVETEELINGKRILTFNGGQLPLAPGVYSVQVKSNGSVFAYANLLLIP
ncbi:MAG: hypothetical protein CFE21_00965 [Bacteroidetes bacterium B1(2017)]|nr:MAG: hypothetical protein CFE21_00965 [Bacteroidetes bacterium B1(2017)]